MDPTLVLTTAYGLLTIVVEGVVWGLAGYVIWACFADIDKRWVLGALATGGVYFVFDEILLTALMRAVQFDVGHAGIKQLLGSDWLHVDAFDVLTSFGMTFIGFALGRRMLRGRLGKHPTGGQAT